MNAKLSHFSELSDFLSEKSTVCNDFLSLLDRFKLGQSLRKLKMEKEKGASALDLLKNLLIFRLFGQNIHQSLHHELAPFIDGGKNQFYRFLTRPKMDWRRLLYRTVKSFFRIVTENSTDADLEKYFILDDTMIEKSGISMEGISRVYDHVAQKSVLGYKLLLLAITDKKSTLPLGFSLHAEAGKKKNFGLTKKQLKDRFTKKRSNDDCMKKRADELLKDKPGVAIEMLRRALKNGYIAKYLPVDKWFFGYDFIKKVRSIKDGAIHVITLLRNKTTGFTLDGKCISAKVLIQRQERKGFKICRQYKSLYARVNPTFTFYSRFSC